MNSFGRNFRITLFGESHGGVVGVTVDGVAPGLELSAEDFRADLERRRGGNSKGATQRAERDEPQIISGVYNGRTTGAPVTILFRNEDTVPGDYGAFAAHPRPSHADLTASRKYGGFNDPRGGGMFSGRMTAGLVVAGVVAKKMLPGVRFETTVAEIGGCTDPARFDEIIGNAAAAGDSVGGIVRTVITGIPAGTGEPFFDSVESVMSHILFAVPGVKGVEFGAGFEAARLRGSENNDLIIDGAGTTATNNDGGVNGGIANGNPIVVRVAVKPAPSIAAGQETFNFETGRAETLEIKGRHDACIALRAAVVVEAVAAIALTDVMA